MNRAAVLLAVFAAVFSVTRQPAAAIDSSGTVLVRLPTTVLQGAEVERQMASGLTTVFVLRVDATDQRSSGSGGARIEIRYELWEEKYIVSATEVTGRQRTLTLASREELLRWWTETWLAAIRSRDYRDKVRVDLKLQVLPFSAREQADTQRWLSRTVGQSGTGDVSNADAAEFLEILVGTSIRRRPLLEYRWTVHAGRNGVR